MILSKWGYVRTSYKVDPIHRTHKMKHEDRNIPYYFAQIIKGELWRKMNFWSNKTLVPTQPFSEICFHDS